MKLSVIIAMYNTESYILKALDSIMTCSLSSSLYEVIVINDGSTDNSLQLVENYKEKYFNIILISKENGGQGSARNLGLNIAQGEYILFLDSDDWIETSQLDNLLDVVEKKELDILSFGFNQISDEGKKISTINLYNKFDQVSDGCKFMKKNTLSGAMCLYLYSRELINKNNIRFIEGIFHEDEEFIIQAFSYARRVMSSDIIFYNYLIRPGSTIRNNDIKHREKLLRDILFIIDVLIKKYKETTDSDLKLGLRKKNNQLAISLIYRMLKEKYSKKTIQETMSFLRNRNLYPIDRYGLSSKSKLLSLLVNQKRMLKIFFFNKK